MSDFKAKMQQIRFSAPRHLAGFKGPTSKGRGGRGGEKKGRNGKGTHSGLDPVPLLFTDLRSCLCDMNILCCSCVPVSAEQIFSNWQRVYVGRAVHWDRHADVSIQHGVVCSPALPHQQRMY